MADEQDKPTELYFCPQCVAEGNTQGQPIEAFYIVTAKEYKNDKTGAWHRYKNNLRRSQLCKRHDKLAAAERHRRRLDPESPDYDPDYHERVKEQKRHYAEEKLSPTGSRYDPELHERQKAAKRATAKRAAARGRQRKAGEEP
jgi:hypothetical protein